MLKQTKISFSEFVLQTKSRNMNEPSKVTVKLPPVCNYDLWPQWKAQEPSNESESVFCSLTILGILYSSKVSQYAFDRRSQWIDFYNKIFYSKKVESNGNWFLRATTSCLFKCSERFGNIRGIMILYTFTIKTSKLIKSLAYIFMIVVLLVSMVNIS